MCLRPQCSPHCRRPAKYSRHTFKSVCTYFCTSQALPPMLIKIINIQPKLLPGLGAPTYSSRACSLPLSCVLCLICLIHLIRLIAMICLIRLSLEYLLIKLINIHSNSLPALGAPTYSGRVRSIPLFPCVLCLICLIHLVRLIPLICLIRLTSQSSPLLPILPTPTQFKLLSISYARPDACHLFCPLTWLAK